MVDVEDILSCSICMEIFRVPRVLPCQHTFCQVCISSYINDIIKKKGSKRKTSVSFKCPLCRKKVELKDEPFDGSVFPINLTIVALLDTQSQSVDDHSKETSKETRTATESSASRSSFEQLLDMDDGFTRHVLNWILNPIANYQSFNFTIIVASLVLRMIVVIYSVVLYLLQKNDLLFLYLIIFVKFCKDVVKSVWNIRQHKNARVFLKSVLGHAVCHIFECAWISVLLTFFYLFWQLC
jgi:hypothetical protein